MVLFQKSIPAMVNRIVELKNLHGLKNSKTIGVL